MQDSGEEEQISESAPELKASETSGDTDAPVMAASPSDLLEHLARMMPSLEKVWAEGLENKPAAKAREEAKGIWQSFITAFVTWNERVSQMGVSLGITQVLDHFPLKNEGLANIDLEPSDSVRRYHQLQIASLYAFTALTDSLEGLDNPTHHRVDLLTGRVVESWWEAGAFSLVRRRAVALARILRAQDDCLRRIAEGTEHTAAAPTVGVRIPRPWEEPITAAADLVSRGWHAAALPQLLVALRSVLAWVVGVDAGELPVPLAPALERVPSLSTLTRPVANLEAASQLVGEGRVVDLGVTVPLAQGFLVRVQELVLNPPPPQELEALTGNGDA